MKLEEIIAECLSYENEREWFEFKQNVFKPDMIGEYISALSNSAAILGKPYAYIIWGISNDKHKISGTSVNFNIEVNNEPLQHYLARNLDPSVAFQFKEIKFKNKRLVILIISSSKIVPTSYLRERYIRIGSSKENIRKFPEREAYKKILKIIMQEV